MDAIHPLDGSPSLHSGVRAALGGSVVIISCFYHIKQRARKAKANARLTMKTWALINKDLDLMSEAWSRAEWRRLRDLFLKKWSSGENPTKIVMSSTVSSRHDYMNIINQSLWTES